VQLIDVSKFLLVGLTRAGVTRTQTSAGALAVGGTALLNAMSLKGRSFGASS